MKCVKKTEHGKVIDIKRVTNERASELVNKEGWQYAPKSEYKKFQSEAK